MAGRRRATGKPLRAVGKAERRRATLDERLALAQTPAQRVSLATDYLRGALANAPAHIAEQVGAGIVTYLIQSADQIDIPTRTLAVAPAERKAS